MEGTDNLLQTKKQHFRERHYQVKPQQWSSTWRQYWTKCFYLRKTDKKIARLMILSLTLLTMGLPSLTRDRRREPTL